MKKIVVLFVSMLVLATTASAGNDKPIQVSQLPQTAQQFIKKYFGDRKVAFAKEESDFRKSYEIAFKNGDTDILSLRWKDILNVDEFTLQEKKTKKNRTIRINPQLKRHIAECYDHIQPIGINSPILVSQKGTTYSVQRINVILKEIKAKYKLKVQHFSCHSLRKTFGRQVYNQNAENAELALVKLMELFNHSSVAITKRYLGLRQEEILQTYDSLSF